MYPNLDNAYAYERERRKDEMREAAEYNLVRNLSKRSKSVALPIAILGIITWLLVTLIGG